VDREEIRKEAAQTLKGHGHSEVLEKEAK